MSSQLSSAPYLHCFSADFQMLKWGTYVWLLPVPSLPCLPGGVRVGIEQHLGGSLQGGEAPAALGAHPMSISPRDVHVRMLACLEHDQWAVVEGLAPGQSALRSTASCFAGNGTGQEGDGVGSPCLSSASMVACSSASASSLPFLPLLFQPGGCSHAGEPV